MVADALNRRTARRSELTCIGALAFVAHAALAADSPKAGDLDWISGHWCSADGAEHVEEQWLPARAGMLIGVGRTIEGERTVTFEFMRIASTDQGLAFIAQPNGAPPITFPWTAGGADWARFENRAHDFPRLVEYRRSGNELHARIAGPGKDGKESSFSFRYARCASP